MDRSRYPDNWEEIAFEVKSEANWECQECGRPCRQPGEDESEFAVEVLNLGWGSYFDAPQRFTLTTAHLDQDPQNNAPSNLRALCSGCHLRHDAPYRKANGLAKRERAGQLPLLGGAIDG
jgi:5-methylcytosine-specific restriction endonuclease McrA